MTCSAALVDHLLKQAVGKDVLVAVVPLLSPKLQLASGNPGSTADETHPSTRASSVLPSSSNDSSRDSRVRQHKQRKEKGASHFSNSTFGQNGDLDLSTLHSVGTLARVRQLTRVPKVLLIKHLHIKPIKLYCSASGVVFCLPDGRSDKFFVSL